jgi:Glu-tRNA(Gln) amidotransferase subunit E-like FAD-binding protein
MGQNMINKEDFNTIIEEIVARTNERYIDVIVEYCERNEIELENIDKIINKVIRQKIELEANDLNLLKEKRCTLPL